MPTAQTYPFCIDIEVIFRDVDAMTHVNNAVYFTYMETARTKFITRLMAPAEPMALPVILAEASCTYKSPAYFGELLQVGIGISRFGTKSFDLVYRIDGAGDKETTHLVALARTVQVMYDYDTGRPITVPHEFRQRVAQFQADWQPPDG